MTANNQGSINDLSLMAVDGCSVSYKCHFINRVRTARGAASRSGACPPPFAGSSWMTVTGLPQITVAV